LDLMRTAIHVYLTKTSERILASWMQSIWDAHCFVFVTASRRWPSRPCPAAGAYCLRGTGSPQTSPAKLSEEISTGKEKQKKIYS
jgi:hypothetical protein